ncbi:VanZ family protein [Rubrivivax sp. RP6-9]|uniref:VanZ family protein n=1 Tax=Rubrivivax sp. RP6-9 TaxID=3415750 RepID=UPI003CC64E9A
MPAATPAATGWRVLLGLGLLAGCWLAFSPSPPSQADTGWDKLNHALAFAALAFCAVRAFGAPQRWRSSAGLLLFGIAIELVQSQLPWRSAEAADVLADAVGISAGLLLAHGGTLLRR